MVARPLLLGERVSSDDELLNQDRSALEAILSNLEQQIAQRER